MPSMPMGRFGFRRMDDDVASSDGGGIGFSTSLQHQGTVEDPIDTSIFPLMPFEDPDVTTPHMNERRGGRDWVRFDMAPTTTEDSDDQSYARHFTTSYSQSYTQSQSRSHDQTESSSAMNLNLNLNDNPYNDSSNRSQGLFNNKRKQARASFGRPVMVKQKQRKQSLSSSKPIPDSHTTFDWSPFEEDNMSKIQREPQPSCKETTAIGMSTTESQLQSRQQEPEHELEQEQQSDVFPHLSGSDKKKTKTKTKMKGYSRHVPSASVSGRSVLMKLKPPARDTASYGLDIAQTKSGGTQTTATSSQSRSSSINPPKRSHRGQHPSNNKNERHAKLQSSSARSPRSELEATTMSTDSVSSNEWFGDQASCDLSSLGASELRLAGLPQQQQRQQHQQHQQHQQQHQQHQHKKDQSQRYLRSQTDQRERPDAQNHPQGHRQHHDARQQQQQQQQHAAPAQLPIVDSIPHIPNHESTKRLDDKRNDDNVWSNSIPVINLPNPLAQWDVAKNDQSSDANRLQQKQKTQVQHPNSPVSLDETQRQRQRDRETNHPSVVDQQLEQEQAQAQGKDEIDMMKSMSFPERPAAINYFRDKQDLENEEESLHDSVFLAFGEDQKQSKMQEARAASRQNKSSTMEHNNVGRPPANDKTGTRRSQHQQGNDDRADPTTSPAVINSDGDKEDRRKDSTMLLHTHPASSTPTKKDPISTTIHDGNTDGNTKDSKADALASDDRKAQVLQKFMKMAAPTVRQGGLTAEERQSIEKVAKSMGIEIPEEALQSASGIHEDDTITIDDSEQSVQEAEIRNTNALHLGSSNNAAGGSSAPSKLTVSNVILATKKTNTIELPEIGNPFEYLESNIEKKKQEADLDDGSNEVVTKRTVSDLGNILDDECTDLGDVPVDGEIIADVVDASEDDDVLACATDHDVDDSETADPSVNYGKHPRINRAAGAIKVARHFQDDSDDDDGNHNDHNGSSCDEADSDDLRPLGASRDEINYLNTFLRIAGPDILKGGGVGGLTGRFTEEQRERISASAIESGVPASKVRRLLDEFGGITKTTPSDEISITAGKPATRTRFRKLFLYGSASHDDASHCTGRTGHTDETGFTNDTGTTGSYTVSTESSGTTYYVSESPSKCAVPQEDVMCTLKSLWSDVTYSMNEAVLGIGSAMSGDSASIHTDDASYQTGTRSARTGNSTFFRR